jgi:hypothetical protein
LVTGTSPRWSARPRASVRTGPTYRLNDEMIPEGELPLDSRRATGKTLDIVVDFNLETADNFGLNVRTGDG